MKFIFFFSKIKYLNDMIFVPILLYSKKNSNLKKKLKKKLKQIKKKDIK